MRFRTRARHLPGRVATGAFILNSGITKRETDEQTAAGMHGIAATAYPFLGEMSPADFAKRLSAAEIAIGTVLLSPFVPTVLAGAALAGFSAGLVGLYLRVPGMRQQGSLRPTEQGTPLAKDIWMLGIGLGFVIDALTDTDRE